MSDVTAAPAPGADPAGPETAVARPSPWTVDRALLLIVAGLTVLGLGIRWYNILEVRPICDPPRSRDVPTCFDLYAGTNDPLYGHLQARLIADGHWFVNPFTAISQPEDVPFPERALAYEPSGPFVDSVGDPPVYQLFLAAASALGFESGQSHRLLSALVGVSVVPLTALLALRLASRRAAIAAAAIAAVHPLLWINDGMLLSEAVYAPLVALALVLTYWFRDGPSPRRAAALGFVVMLAAHTRAEAMVLVPMLVLPAVLGLRRRSWRQRGALLGAAAAAGAALFVPWNAYLNTKFDRPVLMTAASGAVLHASACDEHFYGAELALFIYCPADVEIPPDADEAERDALVRDAAIEYLRDHARRLPVVVAARVLRMWDLYGVQGNLNMNIGVEDRGRLPSRTGLWTYYALLPLAAAGAASMRHRRLPVWPLLTVAVMVTITAALTFGLTRYRVPADVMLVALGAVGLDAITRWVQARRAGRRDGGSAGLSAAAPG